MSAELDELELPFTVPVGSACLSIGEIMALGPGSTITLDGAADGPVQIVVNGLPVATGRLVLAEGDFAVRVETVEAGAGQKVLEQVPGAGETTIQEEA